MSNVIDFSAHYERKHSTRDLLLPAFILDWSGVELAEEEVDRIMETVMKLLEERNETK